MGSERAMGGRVEDMGIYLQPPILQIVIYLYCRVQFAGLHHLEYIFISAGPATAAAAAATYTAKVLSVMQCLMFSLFLLLVDV